MIKLVFFFIFIFFGHNVQSDSSIFSKNDFSKVSLIHNEQILEIDNYFYFGVKIKLLSGWKTYWKNPGDSGETISLDFSDKTYVKNYEILYPAPKRYIDSEIETIGYENQVVFPIKLSLSEKKKFKSDISITYLVCKHICIPVNKKIEFIFDPDIIKKNKSSILFRAIQDSPINQKKYVDTENIKISKKKINIIIRNLIQDDSKLEFFTFSENYKFTHEIISINENKIQINLIPDSKLKIKDKLEILVVNDKDNANLLEIVIDERDIQHTLFFMITIAIIGGFILNFMPCVLPVLSLKIYSLIKLNKQNRHKIPIHSMITSSGIIFSFIALGVITIFFRSIGNEIGWGIQFQSTEFLVVFSIILLFFSLNLIGFFEILPPSIINNLNNINFRNEYISTFFTGVISTILATPCSAPFLGTAVSFAFTQNSFYTLAIFISLGLGFSIPYFLISISPRLLNYFPKPGLWMQQMKFLLGIIVLLTSIWLLSLMNFNKLILYLLFMTIVFVGIYITKQRYIINIVTIFIILFASFIILPKQRNNEYNWIRFEAKILDDMIKNDKLVFVDVTADWCVTCKINKVYTLNSKEIKTFFKENNVNLIKADWTNKNQEIQKYMKRFNKYGIPLNVVYGPKNKKGIVQSELLSVKKIKQAVQKVK